LFSVKLQILYPGYPLDSRLSEPKSTAGNINEQKFSWNFRKIPLYTLTPSPIVKIAISHLAD
jgi:hypothetical protein